MIDEQKQFQEDYGWLYWVYEMAENYINIEKILESNVFSFLTYCNFIARKNEIENKKLNKIKNKKR